MGRRKGLSVEEIINKAVCAQRIAGDNQARDVFRATEKRLYAYPVLKLKIESDYEKLSDIEKYGGPEGDKSIVRFQRSGQRLTAEEIKQALISDTKAGIAVDEHELETIENALKIIQGDPYEEIIKLKYFEGNNDEEIACMMVCDPSTVRRNKSRLVGRLAVFLYGKYAVS